MSATVFTGWRTVTPACGECGYCACQTCASCGMFDGHEIGCADADAAD